MLCKLLWLSVLILTLLLVHGMSYQSCMFYAKAQLFQEQMPVAVSDKGCPLPVDLLTCAYLAFSYDCWHVFV